MPNPKTQPVNDAPSSDQLILPAGFQPFAKLRVGDNLFEKALTLVTIGGVAPLLVGNGTALRVWLTVPGAQPAADGLALVADNQTSLPNLVVDAYGRRVKVSLAQDTLLSATLGDDDTLVVQKLNLRPLGLAIFFDSAADGLHLMGSTLQSNKLLGVPVALVLP